MKRIVSNTIALLVSLLISSQLFASDLCDKQGAIVSNITVDTKHVIRKQVPRALFGFNIPWYAFQNGLQLAGQAKPELLDWLKPFEGALYRYPGGSPSNTFDWKNSVRPSRQRQASHFEYGQRFKPEFGYDEFFKFVAQVDGQSIVTLNLVGPYQEQRSAAWVGQDAEQFVDWVLNRSSLKCIGELGCQLQYLELGNELDWTPYLWSSKTYLSRINQVLKYTKNKVPLDAWVVSGKSAPWDAQNRKEGYKRYNTNLSRQLPKAIKKLAYHPYYDGNSIPVAMRYTDDYFDVWKQNRPSATIMMTEHARWPHVPKDGDWKKNWYQATGLGGAISTSDFILTLIPDQRVSSAVWHSLGTMGPWQLIRQSQHDDKLYPSPVYWGMLTLRKAFLQDVIAVEPNKIKGHYHGGYDQHFSAMKSHDSKSFLGVNRSNKPMKATITWLGDSIHLAAGYLRITNQNDVSEIDDNDDAHQNRVTMKTHYLPHVVKQNKSKLCIPARSIFSLVIESN